MSRPRDLAGLAMLSVALACVADPLTAQLPPRRDSLILATVVREHPCPAEVPPVWVGRDTGFVHSVRCNLAAAAAAMIAGSPDSLVRSLPGRAFCVKVRPIDLRHSAYGKADEIYFAAEFLSPDGGAAMLINRVTGQASLHRMTVHRPDFGSGRCWANWDVEELGLTRRTPVETTDQAASTPANHWWLPNGSGPPVLDSVRIADIIAQHFLDGEQPFVIGLKPKPFRIDTSAGPWNRLIAKATRRRSPGALPDLPDSVAYYTDTRSASVSSVQGDTVTVTLRSSYCSKTPTGGFTAGGGSTTSYITWTRQWLRSAPDAAISMGEGICRPYRERDARGLVSPDSTRDRHE